MKDIVSSLKNSAKNFDKISQLAERKTSISVFLSQVFVKKIQELPRYFPGSPWSCTATKRIKPL